MSENINENINENNCENTCKINTEKTMEENNKELVSTVEALNQDFQKFSQKKVKIAGARVRNNLLHCKKLCDKLRKQIQTEVKSIPTKHRIKGDVEVEEVKEEKPEEVKEEKPEEVKEEKPKRTRKANKPKTL